MLPWLIWIWMFHNPITCSWCTYNNTFFPLLWTCTPHHPTFLPASSYPHPLPFCHTNNYGNRFHTLHLPLAGSVLWGNWVTIAVYNFLPIWLAPAKSVQTLPPIYPILAVSTLFATNEGILYKACRSNTRNRCALHGHLRHRRNGWKCSWPCCRARLLHGYNWILKLNKRIAKL